MRRGIGLALSLVFLSFVARASLLHVHVYDDHDHPDHHQGVAAHDHPVEHHEPEPEEDEPEHFAACEPASHVQSVVFLSSAPERAPVLYYTLPQSTVASPDTSPEPVMVAVDARGHSPPRRPYRPLRAPPRQIPA